jgi:hypothetical protein
MSDESSEKPQVPVFEGWAVLELMGHRIRAGYVQDVAMFSTRMCRIDIHFEDGKAATEFYGGGAIYALRPCTEELAREHAKRSYDGDPRPIRSLEYRDPIDREGDDED